jgi:hypothetical protein
MADKSLTGFDNSGRRTPALGAKRPMAMAGACVCVMSASLVVGGCAQEKQRTLEPQRVAITDDIAPFYDDGELVMYEVKVPVELPIIEPDQASARALRDQDVPPYGAKPWLTYDQVDIQVSWMVSNLDEDSHNAHLLLDPWNEFGRYYPGVTVVDEENGEVQPNLSGYDRFFEIPGTNDSLGRSSRVNGVIGFDATREMAIDFATVMAIIADPPAEDDGSLPYGAATLVNHAFDIHNSSERDLLVDYYIPDVIAGLTGFDIGLRTYEPANLSLEIVIEVIDKNSNRVVEEGSGDPIFETPETEFTIGQ